MPVIPATGDGKFGVVEPFILGQQSGSVARSVEEPTPTIATDGALSLAEPLIAKYNRTSTAAKPVSEPLDTVSTRDRFALVQPVINGYALDIRFRMLQPHELAAAMSFPRSYSFAGNKGDVVRQVGNAVDCSMARALCGAILDARQPRSREFPRSAVPA
jgi:DNA (cytosine-5)-methyltransferase 1